MTNGVCVLVSKFLFFPIIIEVIYDLGQQVHILWLSSTKKKGVEVVDHFDTHVLLLPDRFVVELFVILRMICGLPLSTNSGLLKWNPLG